MSIFVNNPEAYVQEEAKNEAVALIRRMAERFDGATNGKCKVCGAGRVNGAWDFAAFAGDDRPFAPLICSNASCLSNDIRTFILNAER